MSKLVYFAYIDVAKQIAQMFLPSGEIVEVNNMKVCEQINMSKDTICFVTKLNILKKVYPGGQVCTSTYTKCGKQDALIYKYAKVEFRSFDALTSLKTDDILNKMFPDVPKPVAMSKYVEMFGEPEKVKYTLAYLGQHLFYENIADHLWEVRKNNKNYYYDFETYQDMRAGRAAGLFSNPEKTKYFENVLMMDEKSAYCSILLNDNVFPIGKPISIKCKDFEINKGAIIRRINNKQWVKIVFDGYDKNLAVYYDEDQNKTCLEFWNILTLKMLDRLDYLWFKMKNENYRMYANDKTDYLDDVFRQELYNLFLKKDAIKDKSNPERFIVKTKMESIFGKGLQKYNFKNIDEVQRHYRGRGIYYLTPEMSLHCVAKAQYMLIRAMQNVNAFSWDTDGIKCENTQEARDFFAKENEIIMKANAKAGFENCDIGTWQCDGEATKLITFKAKVYAYELADKTTHFVVAGMRQDHAIKYNGNIDYMREHGLAFIRQFYHNFSSESENVDIKYVYTYSIMDGDLQNDEKRENRRTA
jgi:hypothetical protein